MLDADDTKALLRIARDAVVCASRGESVASASGPEMRAGAFVTLEREGSLRGCIGTFDTSRSVSDVVRDMAVAAATRDSRFPPVVDGEVDELRISISVLSPPVEIQSVESVEVGRHGLLVDRRGRRGVLLGKVAVERRWDRDTFLTQTCRKAGLPGDTWQRLGEDDTLRISVFEALDIAE